MCGGGGEGCIDSQEMHGCYTEDDEKGERLRIHNTWTPPTHYCPTLCVTSSEVNVVGGNLTKETKLYIF